MVGGVMIKAFNILRVSWVVPFALIITISSMILMLLARPISAEQEIQSQQLISDAVCLGWNEQFSATSQKVYAINGSETRLANTTIGSQAVELQPRAVFAIDNFKNQKVRIITQGNAANSVNEFHLVREARKGKAGAALETCRGPAAQWWFSGLKTTAGFGAQLVLGNPDNTDVVVALRAFTRDGEFVLAENRRVVVPGDSVRVIDLTRTIPAQNSAALEVSAVDGRIVASVQVDAIQGVKSRGRSFIHAQKAPSESLYFASLPVDSADGTIHLLSPVGDAAVEVFAHTKDGSFPVAGSENIFLSEGIVQTVSLEKLGSRDISMISVQSDNPIVASMTFLALNARGGDWEAIAAIEEFGSQSAIVIPDGASSVSLQLYSRVGDFVTIRHFHQKRLVWESRVEVSKETLKVVSLPKRAVLRGQLVISSGNAKTVAGATFRFQSGSGTLHTALGFTNPLSEIAPAFRLRLLVP
jgi:hypothetical protein